MPPKRGKSRAEQDRAEGSGRRRGRGREVAEKHAGKSVESNVDSIIAEAGRRKQAAERRGPGGVSTGHLWTSVGALQSALALPLDLEQEFTARVQGESLLLLSDSILSDARVEAGSPLPGSRFRTKAHALGVQMKANEQALGLVRQAYVAFDMRDLAALPADLSHEVAVNAANALVVQAELAEEWGKEGGELLAQAEEGYRSLLLRAPEDVELLTNLADGYEGGGSHYVAAMSAYESAYSRADVRAGDDVAGLLHNWGLGLLSLAKRVPGGGEEAALYARAAEKFREEAQLQPTSLPPKLALAEVMVQQAERCAFLPGGGGSQALQLLGDALQFGFLPALRLDASHVEARLGEADVHLAAGKQLRAQGDLGGGGREWVLSRKAYEEALNRIGAAGPAGELGYVEQCDGLYNLACASCLAGDEEAAATALRHLAEAGALCASDVAADEDLMGLRGREWFQALVRHV